MKESTDVNGDVKVLQVITKTVKNDPVDTRGRMSSLCLISDLFVFPGRTAAAAAAVASSRCRRACVVNVSGMDGVMKD